MKIIIFGIDIAFHAKMLLTDAIQKHISSLYSEYPVCESKYFTKALCGQYPSWQQCGCPLRAGEVHLKNIQYTLPDLGVLGAVVKVILNTWQQYLMFQKLLFVCSQHTTPFWV